MNYLNKALDTFNTALVSSVYYVFFTVSVITASTIMYKDWERNTAEMISGQLFGFLLIVGGVWSLNATRDGAAAFADFARGSGERSGDRMINAGGLQYAQTWQLNASSSTAEHGTAQ